MYDSVKDVGSNLNIYRQYQLFNYLITTNIIGSADSLYMQ